MSESSYLTMRDKTKIYTEVQEHGSPVWIVATHGIGEHLGRHRYLKDLFGHDFNICQYDLRHHGQSSGERTKVQDFDLFTEDLHEIILHLQERYKMNRYILFGHSMGGLITSAYIQQKASAELYPERVFINAPTVGFPGFLGQLVKSTPRGLWERLSGLSLSVPLSGLIDLNDLSHNPEVGVKYAQDDLNCLKLHSSLILGMVKTSKNVFSRPLRPRCPAYVTVGTEDNLVSPTDLQEYFTMVEKAFHLKVIEGAYHEIHNEVEKYRVPYFEHLKTIFHECRFHETLGQI